MRRILAFLLLLAPLAASAQTVQYYAYFNGAEMRDLFNTVALITGGDDYVGLMRAVAILGLLLAAMAAIARVRGEELGGYLLALLLFYGVLFLPKVTVVVNDVPRAATFPVANVPLGIGWIAGELSHIGYWLTRTYEQNGTLPNDARYGDNGMVFGARLYDELQRTRILNATTAANFTAFTKDCINPELIDRPLELKAIAEHHDIMAYVGTAGWLNPARVTFFANDLSTAVPCTTAHATMLAQLNAEATLQAGYLAGKLNPDRYKNATMAARQTAILASIPAIEGMLLITARSGQDAIRQSLVMNGLRDAQGTIKDMLYSSSDSVGASMAMTSAIGAYGSAYLIAQQQLPRLRTLVEGLLIVVFPIAFLLILAGGFSGGKALRMYAGALLWVQLWAPMFAVVNYFVTRRLEDTVQAALRSAELTGTVISPNLVNQLKVMAMSQADVATAGQLALWVPPIALALALGSVFAATSAVQQMLSTAASSAQQYGGAAALGNVSGGNVNWGNFSGGNMQTGSYHRGFNYTSAGMGSIGTALGNETRDLASGATTGYSIPNTNLGFTATAQSAFSRAAQTYSADASRASTELQSMFGNTARSGTMSEGGGLWQNGFVQQYQAMWGGGAMLRGEDRSASGQSVTDTTSGQASKGESSEQRVAGGLTGGAGFGGSGGLPGASVQGGVTRANVSNDVAMATRQVSGASEAQVQAARMRLSEAMQRFQASDGGMSHQAGFERFSAQLQRGMEASDKAMAASAKSQEAGTRITDSTTAGTSGSINLDKIALGIAMQMAGGSQAMATQLLANDQGFKQQVMNAAMDQYLASPAGQQLLSSLPAPKSQGQVSAAGEQGVADNKAAGAVAVNAAGVSAMAQGTAAAPMPARGQTDMSPATAVFAANSAAVNAGIEMDQQQVGRRLAGSQAAQTMMKEGLVSLGATTSAGQIGDRLAKMSGSDARVAELLDKGATQPLSMPEIRELAKALNTTPAWTPAAAQERKPAPQAVPGGYLDTGT